MEASNTGAQRPTAFAAGKPVAPVDPRLALTCCEGQRVLTLLCGHLWHRKKEWVGRVGLAVGKVPRRAICLAATWRGTVLPLANRCHCAEWRGLEGHSLEAAIVQGIIPAVKEGTPTGQGLHISKFQRGWKGSAELLSKVYAPPTIISLPI